MAQYPHKNYQSLGEGNFGSRKRHSSAVDGTVTVGEEEGRAPAAQGPHWILRVFSFCMNFWLVLPYLKYFLLTRAPFAWFVSEMPEKPQKYQFDSYGFWKWQKAHGQKWMFFPVLLAGGLLIWFGGWVVIPWLLMPVRGDPHLYRDGMGRECSDPVARMRADFVGTGRCHPFRFSPISEEEVVQGWKEVAMCTAPGMTALRENAHLIPNDNYEAPTNVSWMLFAAAAEAEHRSSKRTCLCGPHFGLPLDLVSMFFDGQQRVMVAPSVLRASPTLIKAEAKNVIDPARFPEVLFSAFPDELLVTYYPPNFMGGDISSLFSSVGGKKARIVMEGKEAACVWACEQYKAFGG